MLYSRSLEDSKFNYFKSFLHHILIDDDASYEDLVRPIIIDAHDLSIGVKNYYTIDRNGFPIISLLVKKNRSFFEKINPSKISREEYEKILELVSEQREIANVLL
jgi:hypothetical protein